MLRGEYGKLLGEAQPSGCHLYHTMVRYNIAEHTLSRFVTFTLSLSVLLVLVLSLVISLVLSLLRSLSLVILLSPLTLTLVCTGSSELEVVLALRETNK